jgi:DNA repair exonuclease SbcCD ATPase subunit
MKIKFNKINISNFRNITDLEINFNEGVTELQASNGKGKTNTLSALMWCLFGKNIYENKIFVISPIIDGEERNDITTNVKMLINDNYIISRTYYNRKTTIQTGYLIDGKEELVSITQTQLNKELQDKLVDEETFKSLSNINYLPNLNWKDLKQYIFDIIGEIKDEEILLKGDFSLIEEQIRLLGINNTLESLTKSDKALNDQIKSTETKYQTTFNIKESLVADEEETKTLKERKAYIENKINEHNKEEAKKEEYRMLYAQKNGEVSKLKMDIEGLKTNIDLSKKNIENLEELYKSASSSIELIREQEINSYKSKISARNLEMTNLQNKNEMISTELENLKKKGEQLKAEEVKIENDTCSACGQKLPEEKIQETLEKLKEQQRIQLEDIHSKYSDLKKVFSANEIEMAHIAEGISELNRLILEAENKKYEVEEENDKQKEIRLQKDKEELEVIQKVKTFDELNKKLEILEVEFLKMESPVYVMEDMTPYLLELDKINEKMSTTITLDKLNEELDIINDDLNSLKHQKSVVKEKLNLVATFNNLKADLVREKAKSKFNIVDFKTREFTQDGTEVETFKICIDGVDYKELNTGMKILVAIDLVNGIQKMKDVFVPVLIDGIEVVTNDVSSSETQMIITRAVKGLEKIEVK